MSESVVTNWKARHPFKVGDRVVAILVNASHTHVAVHRVWMRGESERGLWIAFEGIPYEHRVEDFTLVPEDGVVLSLQPIVSNAEVA